MADEKKHLYRTKKDRWLAGVCGGLGQYFNLDPTLIRVIFILFTLFGGSGILVYIILWIVMPLEPDMEIEFPAEEAAPVGEKAPEEG